MLTTNLRFQGNIAKFAFSEYCENITATSTAYPATHLLALVYPAGELDRHAEAAELDRGGVLLAGQQHAVGLDVAVDDVVVVAVLQRLDRKCPRYKYCRKLINR